MSRLDTCASATCNQTGGSLSFGERKMLDSARSLLVKEISIAKSVTEEVVEADLRRFLNL